MQGGVLCQNFSRLFSIAVDKNVRVAKAGGWHDGEWHWSWQWRRALFIWEEELVE